MDAQNRGDRGEFDKVVKDWIARYKVTGRVRELLNRQALLDYEKDPSKSLKYIQDELNLSFNHSRKVEGRKPSHATKVDPKVISYDAFLSRSLNNNTVSGVEDRSVWKLDPSSLNENRLRHWLSRLQWPDVEDLPNWINKDLRNRNSGGFGSHSIHHKLFLPQLDELLELDPKLLDNTNFINAYLKRLAPSNDVDIRYNEEENDRYLNRLLQFARRLSPAHNTLKATVLHEILKTHQARGEYPRDLFIEYLNLPRSNYYFQPKLRDSLMREKDAQYIQQGQNFQDRIQVPPVYNEEPLVRDYLLHFFRAEEDIDGFVKYIQDSYLKPLLAEAKLVNGIGSPEKWFSILGATRAQQLKERIDIDFLPDNKTLFSPGDNVSLKVATKNVQSLLVKVYRINTTNYYTLNLRPIDTTLSLDGLSATWERTLDITDPPMQRRERTLQFPELQGAGVFVIDLIGNGRSSRALITKGQLRFLEKTGPAGHEFRIVDGQNRPRPKATLWMQGKEYNPEGPDAVITVPFTNRPGSQQVILNDGGFSTLANFNHLPEAYTLEAGLHLDRESLVRGNEATLTIRPVLRLNGWKIAPSLLQDIRLFLTVTDYEGVATTTETKIEKFQDNQDFVHNFTVPAKSLSIQATLNAQVENLSQGRKDNLSESQSYSINAIEQTLYLDSPHLSFADGAFVLDVLGKNGEPLPDRPVYLEFKHEDFTPTHGYSLKSDENGRVHLTAMPGIEWIRVTNADNQKYFWPISSHRHGRTSQPQVLHAATGETIRVNLPREPGDHKPSQLFSLLQLRGNDFHTDFTKSARIEGQTLVIDDIPAANYILYLKEIAHPISIRVTEGSRNKARDFILSKHRHLEASQVAPLYLESVAVEGGKATVRLGNSTGFTRVHVLASRYTPRFPHFELLDKSSPKPPYSQELTEPRTLYVEDRDIGEEYRYILDRANAQKYPGNLLARPGILLNPWAIRDTSTSRQDAKAGEEFAKKQDNARAERRAKGNQSSQVGSLQDFTTLDFLQDATVHLSNLKPDDKGVIQIDISGLSGQQQLHILAIDPNNTLYRQLDLKAEDLGTRENRMARTMDPEKPFSEQKLISFRDKGETFRLEDITSSRLQTYDSLDTVWRLLHTLSGQNPHLQEFNFLLAWPGMEKAKKLEKYSQYSCHELNFFLYHKDRDFFNETIRPYIANKKDKTFLDHWLLGADLTRFSEPWAFQRLNAVEKILLAQSGTANDAAVARFTRDIQDLLPFDPDNYNYRFDTALKIASTEGGGKGGSFAEAKEAQLALDESSLKYFGRALGGVALGAVLADAVPTSESAAFSAPASPPPPGVTMLAAAAPMPAKPMADYNMKKSRELAEKEESLDEEMAGAVAGKRARKSAALRQLEKAPVTKADADYDKYYADRAAVRLRVRQLFRQLESTKEYAENNYYKLPIESQDQNLVQVNDFWNEYAAHEKRQPFFSGNIIYATRNFTEMMLALAVTDLPYEALGHEGKADNRTYTLTAASPVILFHEEVKEAKKDEAAGQILLSQNFYRTDSRYRQVGNERLDNFVRDEFLTGIAYGCQVVLTNPTSAHRKLSLLLQIPTGAIPLQSGFYSKGRPVTLQPYSTTTLDYYFYFPETGHYPIYPVQVSSAKGHIAGGEKFVFNVVKELSNTDKTSWDWISQNSTAQEVLEYLEANNLNRLDLSLIAFRFRHEREGGDGKGFYEKATKLLVGRFTFHPVLWSYSIYHQDLARIREYMPHTNLADRSGLWLESPLLDIDPVARRTYQHLEYKPLVNARAHTLGDTKKILNDRFYGQYHSFMEVLKYKPKPTPQDELAITYYLLLQDRIGEAFAHFAKANPQTLDEKLQHAYLSVYMAFYELDTAKAREIAGKYKDYPVDKWRNLFANALNQIDSLQGEAPDAQPADKEDRDQKLDQLASTEPSLEFEVEAGKIALRYQNLKELTLNYYPMDIELLFSRKPFVKEDHSHFTYIQPGFSQQVELPAGATTHSLPVPEQFQGSNVMVEAVAGGIRQSQAYYANDLAVQVIQNYGHIRVTHEKTGKPLPKTYVKVYCRLSNGQERFYKDGYTDLRGRFDYVSLSTDELDGVEAFSILVLNDDHGAVIKEATPPKQ